MQTLVHSPGTRNLPKRKETNLKIQRKENVSNASGSAGIASCIDELPQGIWMRNRDKTIWITIWEGYTQRGSKGALSTTLVFISRVWTEFSNCRWNMYLFTSNISRVRVFYECTSDVGKSNKMHCNSLKQCPSVAAVLLLNISTLCINFQSIRAKYWYHWKSANQHNTQYSSL